jgi:hypothetical protein
MNPSCINERGGQHERTVVFCTKSGGVLLMSLTYYRSILGCFGSRECAQLSYAQVRLSNSYSSQVAVDILKSCFGAVDLLIQRRLTYSESFGEEDGMQCDSSTASKSYARVRLHKNTRQCICSRATIDLAAWNIIGTRCKNMGNKFVHEGSGLPSRPFFNHP